MALSPTGNIKSDLCMFGDKKIFINEVQLKLPMSSD